MDQMWAMQKERQYVRAENVDKVRALEKQTAFVDEEIDQWVYVLYGLMPDEIAIV